MGKKGKSANKFRKVEISHENIKKENLKAYKGIIFFSLILLTIVIGTSYALFSTVRTSKKTVEVEAGTFNIRFLESNYINLENTYPMTDEEGLNTEGYRFTITNEGTLNGKYNISLEEGEENTLDKSYIKYSIKEGEGTWSTPALLSNGTILLDNKLLNSTEHVDYELKLWLDESAPNEVQGTKYQAKIVVSATQTNANIVDVAQPNINLNGASIMNIEQNTSFTDPGVSSIQDNEEIDVSTVTKRYEYFDGVNTIEVESLDTSKIGTYYIYYEVLDSNENKGLAIRIVNIFKPDTTPPTITVVGEASIILDYGADYTDQGAIAQDNVDGDLTSKIVIVGEVNTQKEGTQIIKYLIIDSEGNTASAVRTIIVKRKYADVSGDLVINERLSTPAKQVVDINITTANMPLSFVIATSGETPSDSDYKLIEELQTEGSAEDGRLIFKRNGNYIVWIKDSEGTVTKREIGIYNIDMTKPNCKFNSFVSHHSEDFEFDFSSKETEGINNPETIPILSNDTIDHRIELYCFDLVDIEEKYLTDQMIKATNPDVLKIVDISAPERQIDGNQFGYVYDIYIKGLKSGSSRLVLLSDVLSDKVGNTNDEEMLSWDILVSELNVDDDNVVLDLGGEKTKKIEISGTNLYSRMVYRTSDANIVSVDTNGVMTAKSPGVATISVINPESYGMKKITVKVVNTVNLTFTKGEGVESLTSTSLSCTAEDSMECEITLPSFTAKDGYEAIGWNTDEYEGVGTPSGSTINVSKSETYYAIANKPQNENIKAVYTYNQTAGADNYCVTGEEATCQPNNCIETRTKGTCLIGTIIKYAVNDAEDKIFYVVHDDGRRMTLQQRENTIKSPWYVESNDNTHGPVTALDALDSATSGWTNVRTQKYTMGTTDFLAHSTFAGTNYASIYTQCHSASIVGACNMKTGYTLTERSSKARMITLQEARITGCAGPSEAASCPIWMYNYLQSSVENGGTMNDSTNGGGYHTMSTFTGTQHDWWMTPQAYLSQIGTTNDNGIRAVIEIDK